MAKSIPAIVTPRLLKWAREEVGFSVEEVAEKLKRTVEELQSWETNKETPPTLRQAEKLAKLYQKSYSVFTLAEPPQTVPLATEYRRLPKIVPGKE
jgi:transcriptional regulator with XRE-family HTH domain